jgi:hypothetical protein
MAIELTNQGAPATPTTRAEISPEVYAQLVSNLQAAHADLRALREGIPFFLSAAKVVAAQLGEHLANIQRAVGSIEIVAISPGGHGFDHFCPICTEGYDGEPVAGLCPDCAQDRGLVKDPA